MDESSQDQLLNRLCSLFPDFRAEWAAECEDEVFPSKSLHTVYQSFLPFVSRLELDERQSSGLAAFFNSEVQKGGNAENAVSTCVLEHLSQVRMLGKIRPFLSAEARRRLRP